MRSLCPNEIVIVLGDIEVILGNDWFRNGQLDWKIEDTKSEEVESGDKVLERCPDKTTMDKVLLVSEWNIL